MRIMYDSITASDIPTSATMVAGYAKGDPSFAWSDADWARFPNAVHVVIATRAYVNEGQVLDVETGDATPLQAPGWVQMRRAAGVDPTVYCNMSTWPAVISAFHGAQVPEPHYWIAKYDGLLELPAGAVSKQYVSPPDSGGHYDLSIVEDFWPGVDPVLPIIGGDNMFPISVDMARGRAWASFEVGNPHSLVVSNLWVAVKALWGSLPPVRVYVTDDKGNGETLTTQTFAVNNRYYWKIPNGMSDITFEWDASKAPADAVLSGYVVWQ